ncbi:MAG: helix-turn-helix transcriptional regulator [Arcobacteraceae bacterium]
MPRKDYDKTLFRLVSILTKLSHAEKTTSKELAEEFAVTVRTIQNDIRRLSYHYPITKDKEGNYIFENGFSLKRTRFSEDELIVLELALSQFDEVEDIHAIKEKIFKKIIQEPFYSPYFIKQDDFEEIDLDAPKVQIIEHAIKNKELLKLQNGAKSWHVEAYKITAYEGIWYLFARDIDDKKIKTFRLAKIKKATPLGLYHTTNLKKIDALLDKTHSSFFQDGHAFEVVLKVHKEVAEYFEAKEFLTSQKILKKYDDGALEISFEVSHDEDIDNLIKSWLPHIEILEPKRFRDKLLNELKEYVRMMETK